MPTPADSHAHLRDALAERFLVVRQIEAGATAVVYLARDLRHDRDVALKVLRPERAARVGPGRFLREIRLAAQLSHPHILPVFDSGDASGLLWYATPYVESGSLRKRLRSERRLPVEEAVRLACEAAEALAYAHRQGVIHRDVKPENILLQDGHVLVADFGIARALLGDDTRYPAGREQQTEEGQALGTPMYMSPEQASGEEIVDQRTDVYALGTVLFEMLTGERPYTGRNARAVMSQRLSSPVPSCRRLRAEIPPGLERVVTAALAPEPTDRLPSAEALAGALTHGLPPRTAVGPRVFRDHPALWLLGIVGLLAAGGTGAWLWRDQMARTRPREARTTRLAVLPFRNLNPPEDEYFADGMTDEVRSKLAVLPGLRVTASASSSDYKGTTKRPEEIGRELGVQYLLTGRIRWDRGAGARSRVRVYAELVSVEDGTSRWSQPFDADLSDIFKVQAEIADRAARSLDLALTRAEQRSLDQPGTDNIAAYDAYVRGNAIYVGRAVTSPRELREAIDLYREAVVLDSGYAAAWARLAQSRVSLFTQTPNRAVADDDSARAAAERALRLKPGLAEGHLAMGRYYAVIRRDDAKAQQEYALGQKSDPNNSEILGAIASSELLQGQWETALAHQQLGQALDPRSARMARRLAFTLFFLRRYPEALAEAKRALDFAPSSANMIQYEALVSVAQGDLAGAREVLRRALATTDSSRLVSHLAANLDTYWVLDDHLQRMLLRLPPAAFDGDTVNWALALAATHALHHDDRQARVYADSARQAIEGRLALAPADGRLHSLLGVAYAYLGRREEAIREGLAGVELLPIVEHSYNGAYNVHQLGRIYTLIGDQERAVDQLETLLRIPYALSPGWLRLDPTFLPLHGNRRFDSLVGER